jgi:hypothetical protein
MAMTSSSSAAEPLRLGPLLLRPPGALHDLRGVGETLPVLGGLELGVVSEGLGGGVEVALELDQVVGEREVVSHAAEGTTWG